MALRVLLHIALVLHWHDLSRGPELPASTLQALCEAWLLMSHLHLLSPNDHGHLQSTNNHGQLAVTYLLTELPFSNSAPLLPNRRRCTTASMWTPTSPAPSTSTCWARWAWPTI